MCVHHFLNFFHVTIISTFFSTLEPIPGVVEWELRYTWTGCTQTGTVGGGWHTWTDPSGSSCYEATVLTVAAVCHLLLTTCSRWQTDHTPGIQLTCCGTSHTGKVTNSTCLWFSKQQLSRRQWHTALTIAVVVMTSFYVFLTIAELLGECGELQIRRFEDASI